MREEGRAFLMETEANWVNNKLHKFLSRVTIFKIPKLTHQKKKG